MKSKGNADSKTYREWYARVFREWGTCGGSILLEATFDCKTREITYCVCEEISRDTEIRYALSINGLIFWWVDTMVALGSGEKQGAEPLKEDVWRHALQAVSFLGLFCASLITLPIANWEVTHSFHRLLQSCVLPKHMGPVTVLISMKTMFLFIPPLFIPDILPQHRATDSRGYLCRLCLWMKVCSGCH